MLVQLTPVRNGIVGQKVEKSMAFEPLVVLLNDSDRETTPAMASFSVEVNFKGDVKRWIFDFEPGNNIDKIYG